MAKTTVAAPAAPATCPLCGGFLQLGVQHACPKNGNGGGNLLKTLLPFIGVLVLQLGGAIWWASGVQNDLRQFKEQLSQQESYFKEQLSRQQQIIDRLDSYFRRPPPQ